jgi:hypothetical protein
MRLVGDHGPLAALLMTNLLTALLTELMGHNPSVVLMVGIAVAVTLDARRSAAVRHRGGDIVRDTGRLQPTRWCITQTATASPIS